MLASLAILMMVVLLGFPETDAAKWLDRTLVAALRRVTRTHVIFLVLMAVILIAGTELLAMAGPFDMALVVMWDVSTYVDIALTTMVVASVTRGSGAWRAVVARFAPRPRTRARRRRVARDKMPAANDDDRADRLTAA